MKTCNSPDSGYYDYASLRKNSAKPKFVRTLHSAHYFAYLKGSFLITLITSPTEVKHKHSAKSRKVSFPFSHFFKEQKIFALAT